jgi:MFS family permease
VRSATRATYGAFTASGFAFSSWASRIPQVRNQLHLDPSELGLVLLSIAVGSVVALPSSGAVVRRLGPRRTVAAMAVLLAVGFVTVGLGYLVGVVPVVVGLFLFGLAIGAWDVAMNVHGALVEQHLGRSIMARFHAGFSLGTVAGALLGSLMVALGVPVTVHLAAVGIAVGVCVPVLVRWFLPEDDAGLHASTTAPTGTAGVAGSAWLEPRTLLVGVFVLASAFAEGTGNDWINVAVIDGYHEPAAVGTLGFALFLVAMTAGRWVGPALLDRYGRVPVVRALALVAVVGLVLFVFGGSTPVAFVGASLWGVGVSLGFPVGMSAGADDPAHAAARVSVIASIGYCSFLAGPPVIGFLGQRSTVLHALTAVAVLLAVAALLAGAVRPPADAGPGRAAPG